MKVLKNFTREKEASEMPSLWDGKRPNHDDFWLGDWYGRF
jgi:hypothetical protein